SHPRPLEVGARADVRLDDAPAEARARQVERGVRRIRATSSAKRGSADSCLGPSNVRDAAQGRNSPSPGTWRPCCACTSSRVALGAAFFTGAFVVAFAGAGFRPRAITADACAPSFALRSGGRGRRLLLLPGSDAERVEVRRGLYDPDPPGRRRRVAGVRSRG